jgi:hypothetical protein
VVEAAAGEGEGADLLLHDIRAYLIEPLAQSIVDQPPGGA